MQKRSLIYKVISYVILILSLTRVNLVYAEDTGASMDFYENSVFNDVEYKKYKDIKVITDGGEIEFDVKAQIIDGRTLVPMRAIFEAFGLEVEWNNQFDGYGYGEIRKPSNLGITSVLVETEFHTNPITADWMIKNTDEIARPYVKGIVRTYNLNEK